MWVWGTQEDVLRAIARREKKRTSGRNIYLRKVYVMAGLLLRPWYLLDETLYEGWLWICLWGGVQLFIDVLYESYGKLNG